MADEKTPPPSRHYGDLLDHVHSNLVPNGTSHEDLEAALDSYRTFEKEDLPAFHNKNIDLSRELYNTFSSHLLNSEELAAKGDLHVNEKLADHKDTLEGALFEALKQYHIGHGVNIDEALNILDKKEDQLAWMASVYDQRTGANAQKGEGISGIVNVLKEPDPDLTIAQYKSFLREETDDKGIDRARKTMAQRTYEKVFSSFEPLTLATYLHKNLPDKIDVHKQLDFIQNAPKNFYNLHENAEKMENPELRQFGLRRKEEEPAADYKKAA